MLSPRSFSRLIAPAMLAMLTCLMGLPAGASIMNFESQVHGRKLHKNYIYMGVVEILANNANSGKADVAAVFDTDHPTLTPDPDLQFPWLVGNLVGSRLGKALIIAENNIDSNNDGILDDPDDEGSRPAGTLSLRFAEQMGSLGFDLLDIDGPAEFNSFSGFIEFYRNGSRLAKVGYGEFINPLSIWFDPTIVYGDRSANRIQPMTAAKLNIPSFDKVVFNMGGSGAIDTLNFTVVPEPSTAIMCLSAIGMLGLRRRR